MIEISSDERRRSFSLWLRTGRLPSVRNADGIELKFNPWHDPANGRFTYAGTGHRYGAGATDPIIGASGATSARDDRAKTAWHHPNPGAEVLPKADPPPARPLSAERQKTAERPTMREHLRRSSGPRTLDLPNPVAEFVEGVGQGLYGVGTETVAGIHAALTTKPTTIVRNAGSVAAGMIDAAIVAEDMPARIQVARAATVVANASARDVGRAAGTVAGNLALAAVPGAALAKAAALRRLRMARPRTTYEVPQIGWVTEVTRSKKPWKLYNDAAPGARAGQAPTLMRTMTDGSKRPVKFDGVQGDYVIDRKWKVVDAPNARSQVLRQSEVLAEHRVIGLWEVPTPT